MRQYFITFLGAAALALSVGSASPMIVKYNGQTGKLIETQIVDASSVNPNEVDFVKRIDNLSSLSCSTRILDNGRDDPRGDITLYLSW